MFLGQSVAAATVWPVMDFGRWAKAKQVLKILLLHVQWNKNCRNFDCCEIRRDSTAWLVQMRKRLVSSGTCGGPLAQKLKCIDEKRM